MALFTMTMTVKIEADTKPEAMKVAEGVLCSIRGARWYVCNDKLSDLKLKANSHDDDYFNSVCEALV